MSTPTGEGMIERRVRVARRDVAWVRWILEAHDNLGALYSEGDEAIVLFAPRDQARELDVLIDDLAEQGIVRAV